MKKPMDIIVHQNLYAPVKPDVPCPIPGRDDCLVGVEYKGNNI